VPENSSELNIWEITPTSLFQPSFLAFDMHPSAVFSLYYLFKYVFLLRITNKSI
jgi:hypothetical protein